MTRTKEKALQNYDSYEKERMIRVIEAINDGRLIYIRFFGKGDRASFHFRDVRDCSGIPYYYLYIFNIKQANEILMGCCIDITSFRL